MASKEEVKLVGYWVSPHVFRVKWALKLKGVEYEYIEEDIFNKGPILFELNPGYHKVPVLVHGKNVIPGSYVIQEYIDEEWKNSPLLPQDPYERAIARFWPGFADKKIMEATWIAVCSQGDTRDMAIKSAQEGLERIEAELNGKKFFGGETVGYLDLTLGWIPWWLPVWEQIASIKIMDSLKFPAIASWMESFLCHPVIKDQLPPREKMLVHFRKLSIEFATAVLSASQP